MNDIPAGNISTIQSRLRTVSQYEPEVIGVIPDGIYGEATRDSVASFQKQHSMPVTGEIDNDTWDRITEVSDEYLRLNELDICVKVFGERDEPISPGEANASIYAIQAMMIALGERFSNLGQVFVTGVYDDATADAVQKIQIISGITPNECIDREFVNALSELYGVYVTHNRAENQSKKRTQAFL